jgi:hypothetical protein
MDSLRVNIPHPKLAQLYDYWDMIRGARAMPARRDMDPLDIPGLLPHIVLLDVERDPLRFRVRLYGTACTAIRGRDLTGHYLDEPGVSLISDQTGPANKTIIATGKPNLTDAPYPREFGIGGHFYRLGLPFSEDDRQVSMILAGFYREPRMVPAWRERAPAA